MVRTARNGGHHLGRIVREPKERLGGIEAVRWRTRDGEPRREQTGHDRG